MSTEQGGGGAALTVTPLSARCAEAVERGEHVCFGISPFNGYFSTARIRELAAWGLAGFERVDFFVPDAPSAFTLEAVGYSPEKAAWKARRQGQYTRNKIVTALASLGVVDAGARVLGWAELERNAAFQRLHEGGLRRYAEDPGFRDACREATGWVLAGKLPPGRVPEAGQVERAVRYFLAELPLFLDTPSIVGAGASVFCYHRPPEVLRRLYAGELGWRPAEGQGFAAVVPAGPEPVTR
ncbi:tRNA-dependent cyclodipeptide synthase [Streptomyces prasinosporus]|uniref:Cyclodipeptide synthase n=2 Tax=Streptomyces TaxID=1883 RepID=A0ABP6U1Z0_9ACTN|nr:tRNA-dependent cyclodipeptide synthase [Streptomyces tricolor]MCG0062118.1 tRNA-dependent cyclodipeptide synthase [Streptomyces tricolor]GHC14429.1 cyclo(L-tyrosyl-L-tyrosyl) synthase [Streptomyces albogriseolus]